MSTPLDSFQSQLLETPIGPFRAVWTQIGLRSFEFYREQPKVPLAKTESKSTEVSPNGHSLEQAVEHYFESGHFEWNLDQLDWSEVSSFHQRVLRACYLIPYGQTLTYGELATVVGSSGAARAVGGAMARNRWPLLIPCHRVVGSSGKLTGYSGIGGVDTKRKLLEFERSAATKSHYATKPQAASGVLHEQQPCFADF